MDRDYSTERLDPQDRNGAAPTSAGNNGNGHGQVTGNGSVYANGNGGAHGGPAPTHAPTGASAVVRPVPGGEHKGMLKLVDFTQPANGTVTRNADQTLTFRPKPGFTGKDFFDYTLRDEAGTRFTATVTVAVTLDVPAVEQAPARAPSPRTPGTVPLPPRIGSGQSLPRLDGGPVLFPGE